MTALVGHSGSGKSTIMSLIPRLYNIDSGDILIDDQSIYKTKIFSLRENVSLVSQDTTLFDDTIMNNIAYGNLNASNDEIIEAARSSYSEEFINKMPKLKYVWHHPSWYIHFIQVFQKIKPHSIFPNI